MEALDIPRFIISLLSFPGIIVQQFFVMMFCRIRNIGIYHVSYFRFGKTAGKVIHEPIEKVSDALIIYLVPFIISTVLCLVIAWPAYLPLEVFHVFGQATNFLMLWLGISIGMHAVPDVERVMDLYEKVTQTGSDKNFLSILAFPFIILLFLFSALKKFNIDFLYGFFIGIILPSFFFGHSYNPFQTI